MTYRPAVWLALHAALIVALASRLPDDAWFVGDPGVKLIAVQNALAHPQRPFEIAPPAIPETTPDEFPQPFFAPHGGHAHAMTQQLFPLLTAPFVEIFGLRGLYVLPGLGWLVAVPLTVRLARVIGARASPLFLTLSGIVASPVAFYGLEFWEHAPAVAAILGAAALLLDTEPRRRAIAAGLLAALAVLLRPEAAWWVLAIAVTAFIRHRSFGWATRFAGGLAAGMAPIVAYNVAHFGSVTNPHVTANVAATGGWLATQTLIARTWIVPSQPVLLAAVVVFVGLYLAARWTRVAADQRSIQYDVSVAAGICVLLAILIELTHGHENRANFWQAFPIAVLAFLPGVEPAAPRRLLWLLAVPPAIGVMLTAGSDGGGQWGPRYLLPAVPFLLVLVVDAMGSLGRRFERTIVWLGFAAIVIGLVTGRTAWGELADAKRSYSRLVRDTVTNMAGASYVVTDVWWLGQMHAAVLPADRVIYVQRARAPELLARLQGADVLLVEEASARTPLDAWTGTTCYTPRARRPGRDGRLVYVRLTCR